MARKVHNQILTKKEYKKEIAKFCKHISRKIKRK